RAAAALRCARRDGRRRLRGCRRWNGCCRLSRSRFGIRDESAQFLDFGTQRRDLGVAAVAEIAHFAIVAQLTPQLVQALVHAVEFRARRHAEVDADAFHFGLHLRTDAHLRVDDVAVYFAEFFRQGDFGVRLLGGIDPKVVERAYGLDLAARLAAGGELV